MIICNTIFQIEGENDYFWENEKMMKKLFLLLLSMWALVSCSDPLREEYDTMKNKVMEIHDGVMPERETLIEYKNKLEAGLDTLEGEAKASAEKLVNELKKADRAMMVWMAEYEEPAKDKLEAAMEYMKDQKVKIEMVDSLMRTSMQNAKEAIENMD